MVYGDYNDLSIDEPVVYVYSRSLNGQTWLVLLNPNAEENEYQLPEALADQEKKLIIAKYSDVGTEPVKETIRLRPYEARVYEL
ncbi:alpha-glucosidase C-terminal domain-containing protein [Bacillota bacterium Lsc_1132]